MTLTLDNNNVDVGVVSEICGYLTSPERRSFILFAGAGSGKTRTLIEILRRLTGQRPESKTESNFATMLEREARAIGVITFTNLAADEVRDRLGVNRLVAVSTIHSFAWGLIDGFDGEIRIVLLEKARAGIHELEEKGRTKRNGLGKVDTQKLERLRRKVTRLATAHRFTYSPNTQRTGVGGLDHEDVVYAAAHLLEHNETLRNILVDRHPVLLVDESQDTAKKMVAALLEVERHAASRMAVGLLGDHRQRVYTGGERDLAGRVPKGWAKPRLRMNHRSRARIVELANQVWQAQLSGRAEQPSGTEDAQVARSDRPGGVVRLFVGDRGQIDKPALERWCADQMSSISGDDQWSAENANYHSLLLEHRMAAARNGFEHFWSALHADKPYQDGLKRGALPALAVFREAVTSLRATIGPEGVMDHRGVMALLLAKSPAFADAGALATDATTEGQQRALQEIEDAVKTLLDLWAGGADPDLGQIVRELHRTGLFSLHPHQVEWIEYDADPDAETQESGEKSRLFTMVAAMSCVWSEYEAYRRYITGSTAFTTQQGVKGAEFDRVLVVLDDSEARGFLFSFDKLFQAKNLTTSDRKKADAGEETGIDRTLRLFYVACSRARESLAIVLWTSAPSHAIETAHRLNWFSREEIVEI